ncbi:MAG TPA: secretin N-terminal domain-containing protein [Phycisphaerae bacterium]|nr:secretin N-terminal domain-containing protein [Phycisphaerae bacterium]
MTVHARLAVVVLSMALLWATPPLTAAAPAQNAAPADQAPAVVNPAAPAVLAQDTAPAGTASPAGTDTGDNVAAAPQELIQLNFPENLEVKALIDYVIQRLGINVMYDEALLKKRITLITPVKVPKDSLLGLLQGVLRTAGLAMVDADQPGWKRIIADKDLPSVPKGFQETPGAFADANATTIMTQVFALSHIATANAETTIKPFLSAPGGTCFALAEQRLLFVTDYADNLKRVARLLELVDAPAPQGTLTFVPVEHWEADELARRVTTLLAEKRSVAGGEKADAGRLKLTSEPRTNQIVIISAGDAVAEAQALIKQLDVPTDAETKTYRLRHVAAARIDRLAKDYAGKSERYRSTADPESGLLIVTAPPPVHQYVARLVEELDTAPAADQSHVRFYKLMNATASDVLGTITSLVTGIAENGGGDLESLGLTGSGATSPVPLNAVGALKAGGPNQAPPGIGQELPKPPTYQESTDKDASDRLAEGSRARSTDAADKAGNSAASSDAGARLTTKTSDATVTADPNTNTIIVIAPPPVQAIYERLIRMLDKRRPQVMIEVTLVTLDTSNNFSLGVELSKADAVGANGQYLTFSSFGLAAADAATGALTLQPGVGFNGILLDPDSVNVVLRALASEGRSEVLSAPRVLVNDNATASLSSVAESPFTSVNASDTVATTSFAGYASAGTTVSVSPHISEGDHLMLQYSLTLNSFTGEGAAGIPPPRQTNTLSSEVTIPDGYTIIVGGLNRKDAAESISKLPILGDIPILEYLFSSRSKNRSENTLFVFIRPVILRDDQFEDLRYLSAQDRKLADLPEDAPTSEPMLMR